MNTFLKLLEQKPVLLTDGATGTNLFALGLQSGDSPEFWNIDFPDRVAKHYRSFIDAGSDIVLTNTFGGNAYRMKLHDAVDRVHEFNVAAAQILVQQIKESGKQVIAAGSMGPTGEILEPAGTTSIADAAIAFEEQALALKAGGVDVLWVETLSSKEEAQAAVLGAAKAELPIVVTMSIDTNGRTMMGLSPADIVALQSELSSPLVAYGTNCGLGAAEVIAAIVNMRAAARLENVTPVFVAKGNCGIPEWIDGEIAYNGTPELMSEYAVMAMKAGARIIGGCCGTTPLHIASMRKAIDDYLTSNESTGVGSLDLASIESVLGEVSKGAQAQLAGDLSIEGGSASNNSKRQRRSRRR